MIKKTLFAALITSSILGSSALLAWDRDDWCLNPYIGGDLQYRYMNFKKNYGHNLFNHNFPQINLYAGVKLNPYFGVEAGWEAAMTRYRKTTLTAGEIATGITIPPALAPGLFKNRVKVYGPHADLVGYYPLDEACKLELIGSLGFALLKGAFERRSISMNNVPSNTVRTFKPYKALLRLMGGLQYKYDDNWSVRTTIGWENTRRLASVANEGGNPNGEIPEVKPRDSFLASLGLVWRFN